MSTRNTDLDGLDDARQATARLHLYHNPGACSRVILNAIEEIGEPYRETCVTLARGEQYKPDFLAINPKGKVPVLIDDGVVMTESPVILYHLAQTRPAAALLPTGSDGEPTLAALSDLIWIAGPLHLTAARIFRPAGTSPTAPEGVRQVAIEQFKGHAAAVSRRYAESRWYYGEAWSIVDFYIAWVFALPANFGFPLADYSALVDLRGRAEARPAFARARAVEIAAAERAQMPSLPGLEL